MVQEGIPIPPPIDAPLPSSFDDDPDFYNENRLQKFFRRIREEPLIPLGCGLTVWALVNAFKSIRAGDKHRTNRMFRRRIYAQGFTVLAMVAGSYYWEEDRKKRKEYDKVVAERKALEKRNAWIRELEARDEEENAYQAKLEKARRSLEKKVTGKVAIAEEKRDPGPVVKAVKEMVQDKDR